MLRKKKYDSLFNLRFLSSYSGLVNRHPHDFIWCNIRRSNMAARALPRRLPSFPALRKHFTLNERVVFAASFLHFESCRNHQAKTKLLVRPKESAVCIKLVSRVGSERQNVTAEVMARSFVIPMSSGIQSNNCCQMIHVLHLVHGA